MLRKLDKNFLRIHILYKHTKTTWKYFQICVLILSLLSLLSLLLQMPKYNKNLKTQLQITKRVKPATKSLQNVLFWLLLRSNHRKGDSAYRFAKIFPLLKWIAAVWFVLEPHKQANKIFFHLFLWWKIIDFNVIAAYFPTKFNESENFDICMKTIYHLSASFRHHLSKRLPISSGYVSCMIIILELWCYCKFRIAADAKYLRKDGKERIYIL